MHSYTVGLLSCKLQLISCWGGRAASSRLWPLLCPIPPKTQKKKLFTLILPREFKGCLSPEMRQGMLVAAPWWKKKKYRTPLVDWKLGRELSQLPRKV